MLRYKGGDKQNLLQTELSELVCHSVLSQGARFWFQRLSSPLCNLVATQVNRLGHWKATVLVLVVLQEKREWPSRAQEVRDGLLDL